MGKDKESDNLKTEDVADAEDDVFCAEPKVEENTSLPIDKGWAWFILLGAVLVMGIFIGLMKASGILFVAFQQRFNATSSVTSLMSTAQNAAQSLSALFVMTIGVKLTSCRFLVFVGGILICASYVITAVADNILWLLISYGVLLGIGSSCIVPTTVAMLGQYFDKRRGLANSVAVSGGSLGGLLFAPLITKLLEHFSYRGCMIILAGINLHLCVSGALFRPITDFKDRKSKPKLTKLQKEQIKQRNRLSSDIDERIKTSDVRKALLLKKMNEDLSNPNWSIESEVRKPRSISVTVPIGNRKVEVESLLLGSLPSIPNAIESSPFTRRRTFTVSSVHRIAKPFKHSHKNSKEHSSSSQYLSGSHMDLAGFVIPSPKSSHSKLVEEENMTSPKNDVKQETSFTKTCHNYFDCSLLSDPLFLLILLSFGLLCSGNLMCMVYVAPHAADLDLVPSDIATIITIYSAIDLVARILIGILADLRWFRRSTIVGTCAVVTGIASSFLELYTNFALMVAFVVVLGMVSGAYFALSAVVIVDYLTVERLQSVLGFTTLSNGAFVAAGYYAMGYLRDYTGSYVASFHLIAAMTLTGGAILFLLPLAEKWKKKRDNSTKSKGLEKDVESR